MKTKIITFLLVMLFSKLSYSDHMSLEEYVQFCRTERNIKIDNLYADYCLQGAQLMANYIQRFRVKLEQLYIPFLQLIQIGSSKDIHTILNSNSNNSQEEQEKQKKLEQRIKEKLDLLTPEISKFEEEMMQIEDCIPEINDIIDWSEIKSAIFHIKQQCESMSKSKIENNYQDPLLVSHPKR